MMLMMVNMMPNYTQKKNLEQNLKLSSGILKEGYNTEGYKQTFSLIEHHETMCKFSRNVLFFVKTNTPIEHIKWGKKIMATFFVSKKSPAVAVKQ